jgi:DNA mismatch repair protein MutS
MTSIYTDYFTLDTQWKAKEGIKTIVLYQVGAFFEVYGIKDLKQNAITQETNTIESFAQMSNLKIALKSKTFVSVDKQIVMAGFRDYQLEFYLQKITESGYSAVVYVQEDKNDIREKGKNRIFSGVYSPGTFLESQSQSSSPDKVSNHLMCIWCKHLAKTSVCGIVVIDIMTGKSHIFETEDDIYDELERHVATYRPNEVLCIEQGTDSNYEIQNLFNASVSFHSVDPHSIQVKNAMKQTYIEEIINTQFGIDAYQNCSEFRTFELATMAYCVLLDFVYAHNRNLVKNIEIPLFNNSQERVILANHTLKQLNILEDGNGTGTLSSVLSFLNNCTSLIGKRRFRQQLLNPVYNETWLQSEYDIIQKTIDLQENGIQPLRKWLKNICDIQKIARQLALLKINPDSVLSLYQSLQTIGDIHDFLLNVPCIANYLLPIENVKQMMEFISTHIQVDRSTAELDEETDEGDDDFSSIMCSGVSAELDMLMDDYKQTKAEWGEWRDILNRLVKNSDPKKKGIEETQYVKIHKTEKSGMSLQITKTRSLWLKEAFKTLPPMIHGSTSIDGKTIVFSVATGSVYEIEHPHFARLSQKMVTLKDSLVQAMDKAYKLFLVKLEKEWFAFLRTTIEYVGRLDVLVCRAYNALHYGYCCPTLVKSDTSHVSVQNLRHVLIEHILTQETYIPNNVELGSTPQGILLFGINSSGKTSLLRSVGISLILAQSGNFVPATSFVYSPYRSMYSRILGNDNLFKGHSSFAVEMSELRVILRMANKYSIVLADEISKGSEMDSAMSITTASLMHFVKLQCSFMITSHLHEIVAFDEIKSLSHAIHLKHLSVTYDNEKQRLIYNRILQDGSGESFYGLLVCKSLHLPKDFIETAYAIRNKYLVKDQGILSQKTSSYNSKKIRGMCESCGQERSEETHHIVPQREANARGFLPNGTHMNHVGNLAALCSACHDTIHKSSSTSVAFSEYRYKPDSGSFR